MEKKETVSDIIEEVKKDICDHYCKYSDQDTDEICSNCPLGRLG